MIPAAAFYSSLQVIAALLIFVAVYLALVLCTIVSLVAAELISEHASLVRDYKAKPASLETEFLKAERSSCKNLSSFMYWPR